MAGPARSKDDRRPRGNGSDDASSPSSSTGILVVLAVAVPLLIGWGAVKVNEQVTEPYMDEIFHARQAQAYCDGRFFEWDPKLTTPPGLYFASLLMWRIIRMLADLPCSLVFLRSSNVAFAIGNWYLIHAILQRQRGGDQESNASAAAPREREAGRTHGSSGKETESSHVASLVIEATGIWLFPPLFFFNFLYYTDAGSLFATLLTHFLFLQGHVWLGSVAGFVSIWFRQTNAVWLLFATAAFVVEKLISETLWKTEKPGNIKSEQRGSVSNRSAIRWADEVAAVHSPLSDIGIEECATAIVSISQRLWNHAADVVQLVYPSISLLILFSIAVFINGGIALGDRSNHAISMHVPQIFYFFSFSTAFLAPAFILPRLPDVFLHARRFAVLTFSSVPRLLSLFFAVFLSFWIVQNLTIEHPFLLSDNRHYSFYVWKNIFRRFPWARFALIPAYLAAAWFLIVDHLGARQTVWWILGFLASTLVVLVPSPLIEPRYFIVAFILARLHGRRPSNVGLILELASFLLMNFAVLYIFLNRPFEWSSEPGVKQRFMW